MYKIAALIDFTQTTEVVLEFAERLARQKSAEVVLLNIIEKGSAEVKAAAEQKLEPMVQRLTAFGVVCKAEVHEGSFFSIVSSSMDKVHASLAIIGTHGKKGLKQNLFGANILKLVQMLKIPSLVVQDGAHYPTAGFLNVLFPIAAHSRFEMKIEQTKELLSPDSKVNVYAIYKTEELDAELKNNIKLTRNLFTTYGIATELVEEDTTLYSVGYSRQTIDYLGRHDVDLVCIMAQVSHLNTFFGKADKENIILNPLAVPVLCCNDEETHF